MYVAPLLETQNLTVRRSFHSAWRTSFKTFMGLPTSLPTVILDRILSNSEETCSEAAERNVQKIRRRFGHDAINRDDSDVDEEGVEEIEQPALRSP
jgi:hypothetical protein